MIQSDAEKKELYLYAREIYYRSCTNDKIIEVKKMFENLGDYKNSADFVKKCETVLSYHEGNVVTFGFYHGKPIEWTVLKIDGKARLLFANEILDYKPYHTDRDNMVWDICSLRQWLNHDFLNEAFESTERMSIIPSRLKNPCNHKYSTQSGPDTIDKAFVFSYEEMQTYLPKPEDRANNEWWWMRTQGHCLLAAESVEPDGNLCYTGLNVADDRIGVRPAMWVMLRR